MTTAAEFMAGFKARHVTNKKAKKPARQQVAEARSEIKSSVMVALREKRRSIPKEWERGFFAAMAIVEQELDK